jgi:hypothetical protein
MEKRYQVFISSTYNDLQEERALVFQALMEMDCFPAGMELFPAADEEQWEFIRKIIDDCDYYLVIIAGRYGSTITPQGLSYTEKEYDYAIEKGMKVLAFVHEDPGKLAVDKSDINEELRTRLSAFRDRVKSGRIVKFWKMGADLPGLVALSLIKTIKSHPSVGWVRANQVGSAQLLSELNELRKRNQELEKIVAQISPGAAGGVPEDLAGLDESLEVRGTYTPSGRIQEVAWTHSLTWGHIFALIAPELLAGRMEHLVEDSINELIFKRIPLNGRWGSIEKEIFQTIKIQFLALGLVKIESGRWSLTSKGQMTMMQLRSVRSKAEP